LVSAQEKIGIKETIEKANAGDVNAQLTLGIAYDLGTDGLKENFKEAIFWYTKSAEQGNKDAQLFLATNYYEGKKVERSYSKAVYWWTKAAEQGDKEAQFNIGTFYYDGIGVEKSYSNSLFFFNRKLVTIYRRII